MSLARTLGFAFTMVTGANDTTTGLLSGAAELLPQNPEQQRMLAEDPQRIPKAIEGFLRLTSPAQGLARTGYGGTSRLNFSFAAVAARLAFVCGPVPHRSHGRCGGMPQWTGGRAGNRSALRVAGGRLDGMALAKHRLEELGHRAPAGKRLCALQR